MIKVSDPLLISLLIILILLKCILTAHSAVFRSCIVEGPFLKLQAQQIDFPDTEPTIFKAVLWFIYTSTLWEEEEQECLYDSSKLILESFSGKMIAAADKFGLQRLKEIYESRISENISIESVAYLLHLAERCRAALLKDACLRFANENRAAVLKSNGVAYLKEASPLLFLELVGYTKKTTTEREKESGFCTRIATFVKESFGGMFSPYAYKKLKED